MKPKAGHPRKDKPEKKEDLRPDQELVKAALAGSQAAYQTLLKRHERRILEVISRLVRNREEARDLVQETFMKAFGSLATYRDEYRFSTWLHRIAANCSIDYVRKKRIEALSLDQPLQTGEGEVKLEVPDYSFDPEAQIIERQTSNTIGEAIEGLPPGYKEVIIYRHKDEKSYQEIAEIMNIPVGTVKARIFRGRELLKKKLKAWRKNHVL